MALSRLWRTVSLENYHLRAWNILLHISMLGNEYFHTKCIQIHTPEDPVDDYTVVMTVDVAV